MINIACGAPCRSRTQCHCTGWQPLLWCQLLRALPLGNAWPPPPLPSGQCLLPPPKPPPPYAHPPPLLSFSLACKLGRCRLFPQVNVSDLAAADFPLPLPQKAPLVSFLPPLMCTDLDAWLLPFSWLFQIPMFHVGPDTQRVDQHSFPHQAPFLESMCPGCITSTLSAGKHSYISI